MYVVATIAIAFDQSTYSINEDVGYIQLTLVLSNPSSTDITIQVTTTDKTATGKYIHID